MNVDSAHLQVLIIFQGIDGSYDAVQLSRIATVVGMKLYLVDREVEISTLIKMTNLDCLYGRTYKDSLWLTAMAEMTKVQKKVPKLARRFPPRGM